MGDEKLDAAALRKLQSTIIAVLGALFAVSIVVAVAGLWPTPWLDELGRSWFGRSSWRLRIVGTFSVFGAGLFSLLMIAVLGKAMFRRFR